MKKLFNYLNEEPADKNLIAVYDPADAEGYEDGEWMWDDFKQEMDILINRKGKGEYDVEGINMGWRNLHGTADKEINSVSDVIDMLPNTELTIRAYETKDGFKLIVYHHDSPMGETYIFKKKK